MDSSSKCSPARPFLYRRKEGAGHWFVARRNLEEQKHRTLHKKESNIMRDSSPGNTLDGPLLIRLHCIDQASELCSVDISEQQLNSVKPDDLKEFVNVAYINASANALSLGSFSSFVSLRELNLSLNWIRSMTFDAGNFLHLEVLDLSYNSLSADDIVPIGRLSQLKVLHLSGNQLLHLPPDLGFTNHDPTHQLASEEDIQFKTLEVLMLDDNKLSSGVFCSLANLKRLQYLNLQGNNITEIPCLELLQTSNKQQTGEEDLGCAEPNPNPDEDLMRILESLSHIHRIDQKSKQFRLPLPELKYLNLANNKIAEQEAVLAAALFPKIHEISIHSNPLTTQRSGDPPLLTYFLHERLGITITRKKMPEAVKLPLEVSTDPKWKVEKNFTKVSKRPVPIKAPLITANKDMTSLCEKRSEEKKSEDETFQNNTEPFFVTQKTDHLDPHHEEEEAAEKKDDDTIPEKFKPYKVLVDAERDPDVAVEPIGTQTAVQMLEHTLKHHAVYGDPKPKLDSIQTPRGERGNRIKQPDERVDEMLREIKHNSTIRDVPLSFVLRSTGGNKQEYKEAVSLLRDLKAKYKKIHKKITEHTASTESENN